MFFKKKKSEKLELLYQKNVKTDCVAATKEDAIRMAGQMLVDTGYVKSEYVDAMLQREKVFSTYMGSELALPHGVDEAKKEIHSSGIAVLFFPNGVDWDGEMVKLVVGIAGVGEEHIDILAKIAELMMEPETMLQLFSGDAGNLYELLKEKKTA